MIGPNPLRSTGPIAAGRHLGYKRLGFTDSRDGARIKLADSAIEQLETKVRELTRRTRGHGLIDIVQELKPALTGWKAYFGIAEVLSPLREVDKWVRRRLRCYAWKQWDGAGYRDTSENAGSACAKPGTPAKERLGHGA